MRTKSKFFISIAVDVDGVHLEPIQRKSTSAFEDVSLSIALIDSVCGKGESGGCDRIKLPPLTPEQTNLLFDCYAEQIEQCLHDKLGS